MKNLNLLFNKTYYENLGDIFSNNPQIKTKGFPDSLSGFNKQICNAQFVHERDYKKSEVADPKHCFALKTAYPGLLIGSGNPHGSHQSDEDINLGFSFDYVTGQPYIPGSSVKGALRCHFRDNPEIIAELLGVDCSDDKMMREQIKNLETCIFDGADVFFDAVICHGNGNQGGNIIGADYITPHSSPVKNPVPILFIKILPDVVFEFRFVLSESEMITAAKKRWLFKSLLSIFGIGAKTNVGYGALEEWDGVVPEKKRTPTMERQATVGKDYSGTSVTDSEMVVCPHCKIKNYKYFKNGALSTKCYKCHQFLYPKG